VSPSWRDRVTILIGLRQLKVARIARGWAPRLTQKETIALAPAEPDEASWQPAVDKLRNLVASGRLDTAAVTLVLSGQLVHYTLVPWTELLEADGEELLFARHCFAQVYGSAANRWAVRVTRGIPSAPRLASAIDDALVRAIEETMAPLGRRFLSLQPMLMTCFNACRRWLGNRAGWFVVAEPGMLYLCLFSDDQWRSVSTVKIGRAWPLELPFILERENSLCQIDEERTAVFLFSAEDGYTLTADSDQWQFHNLRPAPMEGYDDESDAAYAFAAG
jgi:hypothetical protein